MINQPFPIIKTKNLLLRQFENSDQGNVYKGLSHPDIIKYYGISYNSLEETKAQMQFFEDLGKNGTGIWWAICSPGNETFYGAAGFSSISQIHKKAEIGFWLLTEHWKKGIITEAVPLICNYGFTKLDLHRIEAFVETENLACKKAMAKLGFEYEACMRDCEIKNGKFISLEVYAKLHIE